MRAPARAANLVRDCGRRAAAAERRAPAARHRCSTPRPPSGTRHPAAAPPSARCSGRHSRLRRRRTSTSRRPSGSPTGSAEGLAPPADCPRPRRRPVGAPPRPVGARGEEEESPRSRGAAAAAEPEKKKEEPAIATKTAGRLRIGDGPQVTPAVTRPGSRLRRRALAAGRGARLLRAAGRHRPLGRPVHDDASAARAASDLGAQGLHLRAGCLLRRRPLPATHVRRPKLLAHELVHTVQQRPGGALSRAAIQRQTEPPPDRERLVRRPRQLPLRPPSARAACRSRSGDWRARATRARSTSSTSRSRRSRRPATAWPCYEQRKPQSQVKSYNRGNPDQRKRWSELLVPDEALIAAAADEARRAADRGPPVALQGAGYDQPAATSSATDLAAVAARAQPPHLGPRGQLPPLRRRPHRRAPARGLDGHRHRLGEHAPDNMELLDSAKNQRSGSVITDQINRSWTTFLEAGPRGPGRSGHAAADQAGPPLEFDSAVGGGDGDRGRPERLLDARGDRRGRPPRAGQRRAPLRARRRGRDQGLPVARGRGRRGRSRWSGSPEPDGAASARTWSRSGSRARSSASSRTSSPTRCSAC